MLRHADTSWRFAEGNVASPAGSHSFPGRRRHSDPRRRERISSPRILSTRASVMYFDAEFSAYRRYELEPWRVSYLRRLRARGILAGDRSATGRRRRRRLGLHGDRGGEVRPARDRLRPLPRSARACPAVRCQGRASSNRTLWVCCSAERLPLASAAFAVCRLDRGLRACSGRHRRAARGCTRPRARAGVCG